MLRTTPEQQREDRRVMEGDPAARAQRQSVARAWRADSPELLAGASLLLTGPGGLTLVLAGGPPPRRVTVRTVIKGNAGLKLRRSAEASQVAQVDAPRSRPPARPSPQARLTARRRADGRAGRNLATSVGRPARPMSDAAKVFGSRHLPTLSKSHITERITAKSGTILTPGKVRPRAAR